MAATMSASTCGVTENVGHTSPRRRGTAVLAPRYIHNQVSTTLTPREGALRRHRIVAHRRPRAHDDLTSRTRTERFRSRTAPGTPATTEISRSPVVSCPSQCPKGEMGRQVPLEARGLVFEIASAGAGADRRSVGCSTKRSACFTAGFDSAVLDPFVEFGGMEADELPDLEIVDPAFGDETAYEASGDVHPFGCLGNVE